MSAGALRSDSLGAVIGPLAVQALRLHCTPRSWSRRRSAAATPLAWTRPVPRHVLCPAATQDRLCQVGTEIKVHAGPGETGMRRPARDKVEVILLQ